MAFYILDGYGYEVVGGYIVSEGVVVMVFLLVKKVFVGRIRFRYFGRIGRIKVLSIGCKTEVKSKSRE